VDSILLPHQDPRLVAPLAAVMVVVAKLVVVVLLLPTLLPSVGLVGNFDEFDHHVALVRLCFTFGDWLFGFIKFKFTLNIPTFKLYAKPSTH